MIDDLPPVAERDSAFMRRALELAQRGWGQTAPNPMVGAVVVREGRVVGEGWHERYGEPHAEINALREAGDQARGATLYVSLEPCNHHGKTPPCTEAILAAGVARVVMATRDPNPIAFGGFERLRAAGLDLTSGVDEEAARELNAPFVHSFRATRPWIVLKLAVSLDGAIALAGSTRTWLTGVESRREVHRLRAGYDAVVVGIGTVLADDPLLTVRDADAPRVPPRRIVFDRRARLSLESALVRSVRQAPVMVVVNQPDRRRAMALREAGVEVLYASTLTESLSALAAKGVRSMLVEGGARLAGSFIREGLVDRLIIFQAPVVLGADALGAFSHVDGRAIPTPSRLRTIAYRTFGDDVMTTFAFGAE
jgi:diaminohydroxyphosphoribosylaminopyrimidine deaminase / 5-amino-6-(5-phosphoribosylamino)uracil reductase